MKILIITSRFHHSDDSVFMLESACKKAIERINNKPEIKIETALGIRAESGVIQKSIDESDIILADVSRSSHDVIYNVGYAQGAKKPAILVSQINKQPTLYELSSHYFHLYKPATQNTAFFEQVVRQLTAAIKNPDDFVSDNRQSNQPGITPTVFVSYSHVDKPFLKRLHVHLAPLVKRSDIKYWDDSKIRPGDIWKNEIKDAISKARIAILLISADFLASEFIMNDEIPQLLTKAQRDGTTTILQVILKPSLFEYDQRLSVFQTVNKTELPLVKLSECEQEEIFADLAKRVEQETRKIRSK